jgi:hypothetical protein
MRGVSYFILHLTPSSLVAVIEHLVGDAGEDVCTKNLITIIQEPKKKILARSKIAKLGGPLGPV